jgi:hypothetical protein
MAITISGTTLTYNDGSTDTTNTPNATAALSAGAVGSYAMLFYPGNATTRAEGFTIAGSSLRYSNTSATPGNTPGGSWRLMGGLPSITNPTPKGTFTTHSTTSVWLRYA